MALKNRKLSIAVDLLSNDINGVIRKIPITSISPSSNQPRLNKDINVEKLSKSLIEEGLLQPIVVTKLEGNSFQIIAGERRYRAARMAGWEEIECKILNKNIVDTYRLAVIENLQRENLNPIEEALAYKKLKNMFSYTDQQLAEVVGKSRNYVNEILSIADIPENLRENAYNSGINNRNLLVQYAQAIKNNCDADFLTKFQNGEISSVKSAKNFLKNNKTINKPKNNSNLPVYEPIVKIQTIQTNNTDHVVDIKIAYSADIKVIESDLNNFIKKKIYQFINNSNSQNAS